MTDAAADIPGQLDVDEILEWWCAKRRPSARKVTGEFVGQANSS
jgi:hypothetical protein